MNTINARAGAARRRSSAQKEPSQSLVLVLLPILLSIVGGTAGYFFFRGYLSRATEIGVFLGYAIGWMIEASVRVPLETNASRTRDAIEAARDTAPEAASTPVEMPGTPKEATYESHPNNAIPQQFALR